MRTFLGESVLDDDHLGLALAPALTPDGLVGAPGFFSGFAAYPQVLARGLGTLADITATRYFQYKPETSRDPVLTAQGDRLRVECFSACNGVYARLDLLGAGFDGGDIAFGTTNVDISFELRSALSRVGRDQLLHVAVGDDGLRVSSLDATSHEHPVRMPDRWVRAFGNVAELHTGLVPSFVLNAAQARAFVSKLPPVTGKEQAGWLTPTATGAVLSARRTASAVYVKGLNRLSAVKRLLINIEGMTVYGSIDGEPGPVVVEFELPAARLVLGLTQESWRGFSGEGALLSDLAGKDAVDDADMIWSLLQFEPIIDIVHLARAAELDEDRVRAGLAVLATSGRVGWDCHEQAYFHRELPDDPDRVMKDNPRLVAAQRLVDAVEPVSPGQWRVRSGGVDYEVHYLAAEGVGQARCTCTWYLKHLTKRGPCKHILAAQMKEDG